MSGFYSPIPQRRKVDTQPLPWYNIIPDSAVPGELDEAKPSHWSSLEQDAGVKLAQAKKKLAEQLRDEKNTENMQQVKFGGNPVYYEVTRGERLIRICDWTRGRVNGLRLPARAIDDPSTVTYPDGILSPKPDLNVGAKDAKFRYDRDFLLQFMSVCKEKPESLPRLDEIGIQPQKQTPGYGRGGAARGATSGSIVPRGDRGGGSRFSGLGNLQPPSRMSSDERFAASNVGRSASISVPFSRAIPMSRSSNQGGPGTSASPGDTFQGNNHTRTTYSSRHKNSNRYAPNPVALHEQSGNGRNATGATHSPQAADLDTPEIVERKIRSLLNKLTAERFASISEQIVEFTNRSNGGQNGRILMQVIKLIIEETTVDVPRSEMYARLCRKMMEKLSPSVHDESTRDSQGNLIRGAQLFRKYLLNQCQENLEQAWAAKEDTQAPVIGNSFHDTALDTCAEKSEEAPAKAKSKRRGFGLMRFLGELFQQSLLTERIMHECIKKFLVNTDNPEEEEIESLCQLLSVVGQALDTPKARGHMNVYFGRMQNTADSKHITPRMRFMLLNVIELRDRGWVPRNKVAASTKLAQNAHQGTRRWNVTGGSRTHWRPAKLGDLSHLGGDGWNVTGGSAPSPPAKAGDLSHFGKIKKSTAMTFGPSSVFTAAKKAGKSGQDTPTLSRTNASSNMFSMLSQANADRSGYEPASGPAGTRNSSIDSTQPRVPDAAGSGRRRLQLLPRTKPVNVDKPDDGKVEAEEEGPSEGPSGPAMDEKQAKAKIEEDIKELFSVRDLSEGVEYFESLPTKHRHLLIDGLVSKALDMKDSDVTLVCNLFTKVADKGSLSAEAWDRGFSTTMEFLDDIAVDVPTAFTVMARLLKAAKLSESAVGALGDKIAVDGAPVVSPRDRLLKEFATLV